MLSAIIAQVTEGVSAAGDFVQKNGIVSSLLFLVAAAVLFGAYKFFRWLGGLINVLVEKIWNKVETVLTEVSTHSKTNSESLAKVGAGIQTIAVESAAMKVTSDQICQHQEKTSILMKRGLALCMDWAPDDERRIPQKLREIYDEL